MINVRIKFVPQLGIFSHWDIGFYKSHRVFTDYRNLVFKVVILTIDGERSFPCKLLFSFVIYLQTYFYGVICNIWIYLKIFYINWIYRHQLHLAQNTVPIDLCKFGMGVVPFVGFILKPVINTNRDTMCFSRLHKVG
ncbi:hypothetical protein D3C85_1252070 [compost metagenome]